MSKPIYDQIEIAAAIEWAKAKGQLQAVVEVLGCVPSEYKDHTPIRPRHYELLQKEIEAFIEKVEGEEWQRPDRP